MTSLDDRALKFLGRQHSSAEALEAVALARRCFERVSFDLIYGRPGQTEAAWRPELSEALALGPDHLSLYQLTIEPGTAFAALHEAGHRASGHESSSPDTSAARERMAMWRSRRSIGWYLPEKRAVVSPFAARRAVEAPSDSLFSAGAQSQGPL